MKTTTTNSARRSWNRPLATALLVGLFGASPARAGFSITIENSASKPGSTGVFEVLMTNTGTQAAQVGGFGMELSMSSSSGVHFTNVSPSTLDAKYIFAGQSASTFDFYYNNASRTDMIFSDYAAALPGYTTVNAGMTLDLGRITYSVDAGATAPTVAVLVLAGGTSVTDPNLGLYAYTSGTGTITLTPSAVPEPSSAVLLGVGSIIGAWGFRVGSRIMPRRRAE